MYYILVCVLYFGTKSIQIFCFREALVAFKKNWPLYHSWWFISTSDSQKTEAMKLLEAHGITLLPEDNGGSSNMIQSGGRATLALSEAGKMMLSSSSSTTQHLSQKGTTIVKSVAARKFAAPSGSVQVKTLIGEALRFAESHSSYSYFNCRSRR